FVDRRSRYKLRQCIGGAFSAADRCFPRARLQPRANRMLVMKALRQDVAILAFHPMTFCSGVFRHVLFPQMFSVGRVIAMVFDGTSSAQSQTQESTVLRFKQPTKEIHEDSLKKKTAFSACDVYQRSFPCPAGIVAKVRPHRTIVRGGSRVTRGKRSVFPEW